MMKKNNDRKSRVTSEVLDRKPPFNLDAEAGVLGSIILKPDICEDMAVMLRPVDFYDDGRGIALMPGPH